MNAGLSYVADPLNRDVGEVAYCARHYGCPVLSPAERRSCEGCLGWSLFSSLTQLVYLLVDVYLHY